MSRGTGSHAAQANPALAVGTAVLAALADQLSKLFVLHILKVDEQTRISLGPFLDFVLAWNPGISYGLFQQGSDLGRWLLVGLALVAAVGLGVWMMRARRLLVALSLALIVGGAIGNGIDRAAYGAVVDFIYLHALGYSWYVFNLGDAWIVAGVVGLLYDSVRPQSPVRKDRAEG